jgi:mRNA degradation ribonuclease J1/J2
MVKVKIFNFSILPSIGGNAVVIEYKDSRVLLDAGYSLSNFDASGEEERLILLPPEEQVSKRVLPNYMGIEKILNTQGENQIFISHAHSDHYLLLYYIKLESSYCQTHINCTRFTHRIIENTIDYYIKERMFFNYSEEVESRLRDISRRIRGTLNSHIQNETNVGDLKVFTIYNKHSTIQSCGFIVQAEDVIIFYTGDFKEYDPNVFEKLKSEKLWPPDILITEGTRLNKAKPKAFVVENEEEVVRRIEAFLKEKRKKYMLITIDPKNVTRIDNIICSFENYGIFLHPSVIRKYEVARELQQTKFIGKLNDIQSELVSGIYLLPPFSSKATEDFINRYKNELKDNSLFILAEDIEHVIAGEVGYETFKSRVNKLDIPVYPIHASGHISAEKLIDFIQKDCQSPELIIPLHTLNPHVLEKYFGDRVFNSMRYKHHKGKIEVFCS